MNWLFTTIRDGVYGLWQSAPIEQAVSYLPLLRPVSPFDAAPLMSPLTMLGVLVGLASASGVALAAFGVLLLALLVIHLIVTEILGITIELRPPAF
jgi:hypothetical protein